MPQAPVKFTSAINVDGLTAGPAVMQWPGGCQNYLKFNPVQLAKPCLHCELAAKDARKQILNGSGFLLASQHASKTSEKPASRGKGLVAITGSKSLSFQKELVDQVLRSIVRPFRNKEEDRRAAESVCAALISIGPRSELEGMLAAQIVATHFAVMDCFHRAMAERQTPQERDLHLKNATKLSGLYERQLAALHKHRGQGQQKIVVEHVTVESGGQAIVGNVNDQRNCGPQHTNSPMPDQAQNVAPPPFSRPRQEEVTKGISHAKGKSSSE